MNSKKSKLAFQQAFLKRAGQNFVHVKRMMDALPNVGFYIKDINDRIVTLNARNCEISALNDAELVKKITDKHHFTWTHLVEAKGMMSWIGTKGFPLTVVVDKQGIVRYAVHGTSKGKRAELLEKIKEAEAE